MYEYHTVASIVSDGARCSTCNFLSLNLIERYAMNSSFIIMRVHCDEALRLIDFTIQDNRFMFKRICVYTFTDKGDKHHDTMELGR